jgi:hypothetical protein
MIDASPDTQKNFAVIKQELLEYRNGKLRNTNNVAHYRYMVEITGSRTMTANRSNQSIIFSG